MKEMTCLMFVLMSCLSCGINPKDPSTGGQTGEETIGCRPKTSETLERSEVAPSGFSADDVLRIAEGEQIVAFEWMAHEPSNATITITSTGVYEWVTYETFDSNDEMTLQNQTDEMCGPQLELPLTVTIKTEDGLLSESYETRLLALQEDYYVAYHATDLADLIGTFVVTTEVMDENPKWGNTAIDFTFDSGSFEGSFSSQIERTEGEENANAAVSAERIEFGTWGADSQ